MLGTVKIPLCLKLLSSKHTGNSFFNFHFLSYRQFSLHGSHIVDTLRNFLESFRLPGESPIIARILETFSQHWLV